MIGIKGPRGAGKTTLLLQRIKFGLKNPDDALYVSADHPWFYNHTLLELADNFEKNSGKWLFIDEVHKYPRWSAELKNIYDGFPKLKVIFTASSALDIYRGEADLSRRVITYELPGMSFREYILFKRKVIFPQLKIEEILTGHTKITGKILDKIKPIPLFREYLKTGYFPYFSECSVQEYYLKLNQTINTILESDLSMIKGYSSGSIVKLKKLLGVIAESVPFHPNISSIAQKSEISRDSVYLYLHNLEQAKLINLLSREGRGMSVLGKPDKIFLENTNLNHSLKENPDKGNIRETFLLNQLLNAGLSVVLPGSGDFLVNKKYTIEVGGKSKNSKQIRSIKNSFIAADDIEYGFGNKIPIWLFGFLY